MATSYKTPGVYIEEISKFPPSIAQVETAIPAFVGYTDKAVIDSVDFHAEGIIEPIKIKSFPDFEFVFGGAANPTTIEIDLNEDNSVKKAVVNGVNLLYDSMRMFYANGGGDCYVVSVGKHNNNVSQINKDQLLNGLKSIEKVDQPTLLVVPESVHLTPANAGEIHVEMLSQCNKLQDRFSVLDVVNGDKEITNSIDPIADFRNNVGMSHLKYGAAYYPWLKTTLSFRIDYDTIVGGTFKKATFPLTNVTALFNSDLVNSIAKIDADITSIDNLTTLDNIQVEDRDDLKVMAQKIVDYFEAFYNLTFTDDDNTKEDSSITVHKKYIAKDSNFHGLLKKLFEYNHFSIVNENGSPITDWDNKILDDSEFSFYSETFVPPTSTNENNVYSTENTAVKATPYFSALTDKIKSLVKSFNNELNAIRRNRTDTLLQIDPVYKGIVNAIKSQGIVLPPSGAIVGLYAMVDNNRGVWKAPANVSIAAVKGPAVNITHEDQGDMNIHADAGKSVNAIRAFTGKGTMVWGARTLAGNDNEWRYVNVRRFFIMVEESVKKSTAQFVFEANDANTWVKVRAMIENFLVLQWRAGALVGAKPEQAFYVRVGLGQTMTAQDVLNGLMNVEIGMAVVRPAEFIVLKFSHKLQES